MYSYKISRCNQKTLLIFSILFLVSCVAGESPQIEPTLDVGLIYTQAVETAQKEFYLGLTNTALALPTPTLTITPTNTLVPTATTIPTNTPAWYGITNASCIPNNEPVNAKVAEIVDGDTIRVYIDDKVYSIRYIGIDTPETNIDFYSLESKLKNAELVEGMTVTLIKDVSETDVYGRLLRYVISGNTFVNLELVEKGYARAVSYPPDVSCESAFQMAEQTAKIAAIGVWQAPTQPPIVIVQNTPSSGGSNCHPAYPDVCIKGPPPDLDCKDVPYRRFRVLSPDPHNFDGDGDGIGCES